MKKCFEFTTMAPLSFLALNPDADVVGKLSKKENPPESLTPGDNPVYSWL
jgi:hypothetical protein